MSLRSVFDCRGGDYTRDRCRCDGGEDDDQPHFGFEGVSMPRMLASPIDSILTEGDQYTVTMIVATTIGIVVAYLLAPMRSHGQDSWKIAASLMSYDVALYLKHSVFLVQLTALERRQENTVMKLVDSETDKVFGASMCGPVAAEIMQEIHDLLEPEAIGYSEERADKGC